MISAIENQKFAVFCEASGEELSLLTSAGWVLVAVLEVDGPLDVFTPISDEEARRGVRSDWDPKTGRQGKRSSVMGKIGKYLLGQSEASAVKEANVQMAEANERAAVLQAQKYDAEQKQGEAEKAKAKAEEEKEIAVAREREIDRQLSELRTKSRKLEIDFAAVRRHFGDKQFDEALAQWKANSGGSPYR